MRIGSRGLWRRREFSIAVVVLAAAVAFWTFFLGHIVIDALIDRQMHSVTEHVESEATLISEDMGRELLKSEIIARAVAAVIEREPNISRAKYEGFLRPLTRDESAIVNVATSREYIVDRVYPVKKNEKVLGIDFRNYTSMFADVEVVRLTGQTVISGPIDLIQGGRGFIQRTPIYQFDDATGIRTWSGTVSTVINLEMLLDLVNVGRHFEDIEFALNSVGEADTTGVLIAGNAKVLDHSPVLRYIDAGSQTWQLAVAPTNGWPNKFAHSHLVWAGVALFCLIIGLVCLTLWCFYKSKCMAEAQLRSAIESIDDGFAMYDPEDRLVFANDKYRSYYSLSQHVMAPGNTFECILRAGLEAGQYSDAMGREEEWLQERLANHRNPTKPVEQKLSDGRWLKVAETKSADGNIVGFRVDITELKHAKEQAEAANQAKTAFLNMISHELRTPLTSVIGYGRLLENLQVLPSYKALREHVDAGASKEVQNAALDVMCSEVSGMAARITVSSHHLLGLINDLLDLAKLETNTTAITPAEFDLKSLVDTVVSSFDLRAAEKGIEVVSSINAWVIKADEFRLRQALLNVIGNAVKFTNEGGVYVSSEQGDGELRLIVRDTGCGIDAEFHDRIFEQFAQIDESITRRNTGTGLGLAITREILALHGGSIIVDSTPGQGSTFTLVLPTVLTTLASEQTKAA